MNRYLSQKSKAIQQLRAAKDLYSYIDAVRYAYGLAVRYRNTTLAGLIKESNANERLLNLCIKGKILVSYDDDNSYFFDKEKAISLQEYISEHSTK